MMTNRAMDRDCRDCVPCALLPTTLMCKEVASFDAFIAALVVVHAMLDMRSNNVGHAYALC
eukprot:414202-Amphidinium_carterae.1